MSKPDLVAERDSALEQAMKASADVAAARADADRARQMATNSETKQAQLLGEVEEMKKQLAEQAAMVRQLMALQAPQTPAAAPETPAAAGQSVQSEKSYEVLSSRGFVSSESEEIGRRSRQAFGLSPQQEEVPLIVPTVVQGMTTPSAGAVSQHLPPGPIFQALFTEPDATAAAAETPCPTCLKPWSDHLIATTADGRQIYVCPQAYQAAPPPTAPIYLKPVT